MLRVGWSVLESSNGCCEAVSTPTETGDSSLLLFHLCNRSSVNGLCRQGRSISGEGGGTSIYWESIKCLALPHYDSSWSCVVLSPFYREETEAQCVRFSVPYSFWQGWALPESRSAENQQFMQIRQSYYEVWVWLTFHFLLVCLFELFGHMLMSSVCSSGSPLHPPPLCSVTWLTDLSSLLQGLPCSCAYSCVWPTWNTNRALEGR